MITARTPKERERQEHLTKANGWPGRRRRRGERGGEVRYRLDRYRSSADMAAATFTHVHTSAPDVFAAPRGMH